MEILIFILVLTLLIIVLTQNSNLNRKIDILSRELSDLRQVFMRTEKPVSKLQAAEQPKGEERIPSKVGGLPLITEPEPQITFVEKPKVVVPVQPQRSEPKVEAVITPKKPEKTKVALDIEKFIGENLISKIGIIILVLGIGYFVKYAIDQNWINEYGRVAIGLLTGGALIALAHKMRKDYKTFSSLLTGGGFAVFYLTISIAFHQYHLFSQAAAFVILVIITIFSVLLSLAYDKKELAIFSQLGGYAAPFMVSTGEGNYVVLFSYLLILNGGLIAMAYYKRWYILNLIAYVFTVILFSGWLTNAFFFKSNPPYIGALVFATLFYLVFFLVNMLNNLKEQRPFKAIEITMILSNNLFYFLAGMAILHGYHNGMFKGLFTVLVGLYNFAWVFILYRKQQIDKNFIYLLIGLVMSYVSLAIPIQMNGHSITLFWTAELVILLWLSNMSGIRLLKIGHMVMLILVIISILMDWVKLYSQTTEILPVVVNRVFITGMVVIAGLVGSRYFLKLEKDESFVKSVISVQFYKQLLGLLIFVFAYLVLLLELTYQLNRFNQPYEFRHTVYGIYNFAYLFTILLIVKKQEWKGAVRWLFYASLAMLFVYVVYYLGQTQSMRYEYYYQHTVSVAKMNFHYLIYPFIFGVLVILYNVRNQVLPEKGFLPKAFLWYVSIFCVIVASVELDNIVLLTSATSFESMRDLLRINHKVGYPILWGVCAFVLMLWGMRSKIKDYRIISLSLFSLIILKLFLFDVWSMNEGGRIAAFIFLGVILLVVSFLYQKLKRIFLEEKESNQSNHEE